MLRAVPFVPVPIDWSEILDAMVSCNYSSTFNSLQVANNYLFSYASNHKDNYNNNHNGNGNGNGNCNGNGAHYYDWKQLIDWAALPCELVNELTGKSLSTCQFCRLSKAHQNAFLLLVDGFKQLIGKDLFSEFLKLLEQNMLNDRIQLFLWQHGQGQGQGQGQELKQKERTMKKLLSRKEEPEDKEEEITTATITSRDSSNQDARLLSLSQQSQNQSQKSKLDENEENEENEEIEEIEEIENEENEGNSPMSGVVKRSQEVFSENDIFGNSQTDINNNYNNNNNNNLNNNMLHNNNNNDISELSSRNLSQLPSSFMSSEQSSKLSSLLTEAKSLHSEMVLYKETAIPTEIVNRLASEVISNCNSDELNQVCDILELENLPEVSFFPLLDQLVNYDFGVALATVFVKRTFLPKILNLSGTVSRVLLNIILTYSKKFERAVVSGLLIPLCVESQLEPFQSAFMVRLIKESSSPNFISLFMSLLFNQTISQSSFRFWTDPTIEVINAAVSSSGVILDSSVLRVLLLEATKEKEALATSLKFASFLHSIILKHGATLLDGQLVPLMEHLLDSNSTFMVKTAKLALQKLQS